MHAHLQRITLLVKLANVHHPPRAQLPHRGKAPGRQGNSKRARQRRGQRARRGCRGAVAAAHSLGGRRRGGLFFFILGILYGRLLGQEDVDFLLRGL